MRSAMASIARPSAPVKKCHGPALREQAGFHCLVSKEADHGYQRRGSISRREKSAVPASRSRRLKPIARPLRFWAIKFPRPHKFRTFQENGKRATSWASLM